MKLDVRLLNSTKTKWARVFSSVKIIFPWFHIPLDLQFGLGDTSSKMRSSHPSQSSIELNNNSPGDGVILYPFYIGQSDTVCMVAPLLRMTTKNQSVLRFRSRGIDCSMVSYLSLWEHSDHCTFARMKRFSRLIPLIFLS